MINENVCLHRYRLYTAYALITLKLGLLRQYLSMEMYENAFKSFHLSPNSKNHGNVALSTQHLGA